MYPDMNVNGVGGANGSGRTGESRQRSEQDPRNIQIFGSSSNDDDIDMSQNLYVRKMQNAKNAAEDASQTTQTWIERVKYYVSQGYSYAKATAAADEDTGTGSVNRGQLVQRLVNQGYDRETAERLIPRNVDQRIDDAREKGRAEGERRIQELDQKLEDIKRRR